MLMFQVDPKFYEATNSTGLKCLNSLTCSAWLLPAHAEKLTFLHVAIATEGRGLSKCLELYCFETQPIARIQILYKWIRLD